MSGWLSVIEFRGSLLINRAYSFTQMNTEVPISAIVVSPTILFTSPRLGTDVPTYHDFKLWITRYDTLTSMRCEKIDFIHSLSFR